MLAYFFMAVTVSPSIMKAILAEAGFPIISYEEVGLTEVDAAELFLWPAMQMYFSYYPNVKKMSYPISGPVDIPFPDELTYGVAHARVAISSGSSSMQFNPLHNTTYRYSTSSGISAGRRGDPYNTPDIRILEQSAAMTLVSLRKAGNFDVDYENRRLTGTSNVSGELVVNWAKYSENFAAVKFVHQQDVIQMARAQALRFFGMLRKQGDPNDGVALDGDTFIQRADQLEEKLTEKWQSASKIVLLK